MTLASICSPSLSSSRTLDGLLHVSEMANYRVATLISICKAAKRV